MNIYTRQPNILRNKPQNSGNKNSSQNNQNLNFTANIKINKKAAQTVYENAQSLFEGVNEALGDNYLQSLLKKANITFDDKTIAHANRTLVSDAIRTARSVRDIPFRIANSITQKFNIKTKETGWLADWVKKNEAEQAFHKAIDIIEEYARPATINNEIDPDKASKIFKNTIASNITKVKKSYESRDERTLNRIVTASVSALYSGADFYNISMLQKDNKKEAKKSQKKRLGQEFTRMATSAALTFISLGILDRYTKKSLLLNATVIAGATLISEIFSRLIKGNALHPLTPKQAEQIAKNNKNNHSQQAISFNSKLDNERQVFRQMLFKNNGLETTQAKPEIKTQETTAGKNKKSKALKVFLSLFALANIAYIGKKVLKNDFNIHKLKMELCDNFNKNGITDEVKNKLNNIEKQIKTSKKYNLADNLEDILTKRKVKTDLETLSNKIKKLKEKPESNGITKVLETYLNHIGEITKTGKTSFETETSIPVISGLYSGITKIIQTIYTILSLPATLISGSINKHIDKNFRETEELYNYIKSEITPNYKKELTELGKIFGVNEETNFIFQQIHNVIKKISNTINPKTEASIIDTIQKRTRNVEIGAETGDLANLSRTMVTALTTWFFVSDHWNEVLIESEGKDIEGAKEERNERLMHKLSNFIINGTLMNTFNTIFKSWLNKSLLGAMLVASATEATNEFLVRKSTCQPIGKKSSKQEIIDYENEQLNKGGFAGWWARTFKKITGKKTLTQKAGIKTEMNAHQG